MAEIFASKTAEIEEREVINAQISRKLYQFIQKKWRFSEIERVRRSKAVRDQEM